MNRKLLITLGVVALVLFLLYRLTMGPYNNMVQMDEQVSKQWSFVESSYQRRADLIPNLVNTVKGYAEHEKSTLEEVVAARASATSVKIDPSKITPEAIANFQKAQDGLSSSLSKLLVVVEKYPDLKANQNFLELQSQLEGTENRINIERNKFNEAVNELNTYIRKFPNNLSAGIFGFSKRGYFEAASGSEKAPEVKF